MKVMKERGAPSMPKVRAPQRSGGKAIKGVPVKVKVTPVRLAPSLRLGLEMLQGVLKQPVNKLINEAVEGYIERRTAEVESDLQAVLGQIKAYRRKDPTFDAAMARFVEAEAGLGAHDPAQGVVLATRAVKVGPSQTMVRELLDH
jgi:hypothetical protein